MKSTKDRDQERKELGRRIGPPPKCIGEPKAEQGRPSAKRKKSRKLKLVEKTGEPLSLKSRTSSSSGTMLLPPSRMEHTTLPHHQQLGAIKG